MDDRSKNSLKNEGDDQHIIRQIILGSLSKIPFEVSPLLAFDASSTTLKYRFSKLNISRSIHLCTKCLIETSNEGCRMIFISFGWTMRPLSSSSNTPEVSSFFLTANENIQLLLSSNLSLNIEIECFHLELVCETSSSFSFKLTVLAKFFL